MRFALVCAAVFLLISPAFADTPPTTAPTSALVTVRMLDSKEPVAGAKVSWDADDQSGSGVTSASGELAITGIANSIHGIVLRVKRDGMTPMSLYWTNPHRFDAPSSQPSAPPHFDIVMEKGSRVSGLAVDENGAPIAGAKIFLDVHKKYSDPNQHPDIRWESVKTDRDGRWAFDGIPNNPEALEVGGYDVMHLESDSFDVKEYKPRSALLDGTAKLTYPTGFPLEVTVVKPDGSPAAGASVFFGHAHQVVNKIYPVKTDAQGRVTFGLKSGVGSTLTASLDGFGPVRQGVSIGNMSKQVTLKLTAATPRSMEITDGKGNPIKGASIYLDRWKDGETLDVGLESDASGHVSWKNGPADGVNVRISTSSHAGKTMIWPPGETAHVVLTKPATFTGIVVDADTGKPINHYLIRPGAVWEKGERIVYQTNGWMDSSTKKSEGKFVIEVSQPAYQYVFRVQSDAYLPEESEIFLPDGEPKTFEFKLHAAPQIAGKVVDESGKSVKDAEVYLVVPGDWMYIYGGEIQDYNKKHFANVMSDADGRFALPPQRGEYMVVALCPQGSAIARRKDLTDKGSAIKLRPWAKVQGTIKIDNQPAPDTQIYGSTDDTLFSDGMSGIRQQYGFRPNKDGHFSLPRVSAGPLKLSRIVSNHAPGRSWYITLAAIDVQGGGNYDLHPGDGLSVRGQLAIPAGKEWMIRQARIEPKGRPHQDGVENIEVLDDGHFRAAGLEPGEYAMHIALHEFPPDNACGWGKVVGEYDADIKLTSASIDIGTIQPSPVQSVQLATGDAAPDFDLKTLDGKPAHLADLKGKVVLLDFWATWCAPCVAEIPNMKAICDAHGADGQFVMLSVCLDEKDDILRRYISTDKLAWPQVLAGVDSAVVKTYGATAVPATFLIGPNGRIVAKDLRGQDLKNAVDAALRK